MLERVVGEGDINIMCVGTLLTALDMHGTGVSTTGAKAFLEVLKYNTTIEVLDLRRNPLIGESLVLIENHDLVVVEWDGGLGV